LPGPETHADPAAAYRTIRLKAAEIFYAGKRIEALPLLEEVVKANPKDDEMLVALADSLGAHAATLTDDTAAGKERLRARDLLQQAEELGNTSPLASNLSQFLRQMPPSGAIIFSENVQVERIMRAGEAAFAEGDFAEALKNYAKALELEPNNYSAVLFTANTYDRESKFVEAEQWYQRAIHLDPKIETAYRYYADMLAKEGDLAGARTMLIRAAVAEPYNQAVCMAGATCLGRDK
jgi:tetratricopeptide (TPR) repeat protein